MTSNSFGRIFSLTSFGESHGPFIGGVVQGFPSNFELDIDHIQKALDRRRPGQSELTTQRDESDKLEIISGVFEGRTTGMPIAFLIANKDSRSKDYSQLKDSFRPSHADLTWQQKYGHRDHRGGGRSSARETAVRVVAGAMAQQVLDRLGISVKAYTHSIGTINMDPANADLSMIENNKVRCPDAKAAEEMISYIEKMRSEGDSCGGIVECRIEKLPIGLGEPVFDRLEADLAKAMLSINAVKGFEIGSGFAGTQLRGSEHNDAWIADEGKFRTATNHSGGVQGGVSNGMPVEFKVAFKPTATIAQVQRSVNMKGEAIELEVKGRHDPCVIPRAVPIVEAMASIVILDHYLMNNNVTLKTN